MCGTCRKEVAHAQRAAAEAFRSKVADAILTDTDLGALQTALVPLEEASGLSAADRQAARVNALRKAVQVAILDGSLTELEEKRIDQVAAALSVTGESVVTALQDLGPDIALARINAGRLTAIPSPSLMTKRGEAVYLEVPAQLLKEVVDLETRGGYSGVSFRVAKGVRVHTGGFRGHSVVVGSHVEIADAGLLSVTSTRVVFAGGRRSIDVSYGKLLGLRGFNDGIGLQVANRASQPILKVPSGAVVVAVINAAASRAQ
jgi:hypothetical protein